MLGSGNDVAFIPFDSEYSMLKVSESAKLIVEGQNYEANFSLHPKAELSLIRVVWSETPLKSVSKAWI